MKFILLLVPFFMLQSARYSTENCTQNKLQIDVEKIYKHQIESTTTGYQDLFTIMHPDSSVKYLINVIRKKSPIDYQYLKSEEYKNGFSGGNIKIEEVQEIKYKSFIGVRFRKRITSLERVFLSYSVSTIIKGDLLVITYNTIESNFTQYENDFNYSVNSIKFY